jgi:hypothetical protein
VEAVEDFERHEAAAESEPSPMSASPEGQPSATSAAGSSESQMP